MTHLNTNYLYLCSVQVGGDVLIFEGDDARAVKQMF
jgi:hypothetical protein